MTGAPELQTCPHCGKQHPDDQLRCPVTDLPLPLAGRVLDAKFRLVRELGTGGMASVWLAINVLVDKEVAIKLIRPDVSRDSDTMARFRNEARAAGRIGSLHICDIFDFGQSPIGPYIVMELLQGENLAQLIHRSGRLGYGLAASIARDALSGLEAAHAAGIVHRDLKPENIFLHRRDDGSMIVKIMDFGVSKFTDGSSDALTAHGMLLGTPQYMSPEQVQGAGNVDVRADIWALGAILYRALTGKDAFLGSTVPASLMKVTSEDPMPLGKLAPDVPAEIVDVVTRCLQRDPEARFQRAQELSRALAPYADDIAFQELAGKSFAANPQAVTVLADASRGATAVATGKSARGRGRTRPSRSVIWGVLTAIFMLAGGALAWALIAPVLSQAPEDATAQPAGADRSGSMSAAESAEATVPPSPAVAPPPATTPAPDDSLPDPAPSTPPPDADAPQGSEGETEAGQEAAAQGNPDLIDPPPPEPSAAPGTPAGIIVADGLLTLADPGPPATQPDAKTYCRLMATQGHLGVSTWRLANPSEARTFEKAEALPKGRYWTTARWRGKAATYVLPGGRKASLSIRSKKARPLCVAPQVDD